MDEWSCQRCSLQNRPSDQHCDACGLSRNGPLALDTSQELGNPMEAFFRMALAGSKRNHEVVIDLASSDEENEKKKKVKKQKKEIEQTKQAPELTHSNDEETKPVATDEKTTNTGAENVLNGEFKVASLNVWFDEVLVLDRVRNMVNALGKLKPHVVFLQEVTPEMCRIFKTRMAHLGYTSPSNLDDRPYGEMIFHLRSLPMHDYSYIPFERTQMGRGLHVLETTFWNKRIVVATSHLESLQENRAVRLEQLQWAFDHLSTHDHWIFGGDTNLGNKDKIDLPDNILDAWIACGSERVHQYTWDTSINKNLQVKYSAKCRFDRLFSHGCTPKNFLTFGKEKLPSHDTLYPSDHWGIMSSYTLEP
ncbi:hypothetical protein THRCLA_11380 [Thraustotheca clavata]|uniref:RanBP2-type domain-containing protein n=1 Tax=Thraustotheca clavata TaxID=74557 RepID=A0A1V9Y800_9STRA|nr:hypothetical protein THRCLA_11380 [Thraustotheca clavata]